jgi:hypothetical protein
LAKRPPNIAYFDPGKVPLQSGTDENGLRGVPLALLVFDGPAAIGRALPPAKTPPSVDETPNELFHGMDDTQKSASPIVSSHDFAIIKRL